MSRGRGRRAAPPRASLVAAIALGGSVAGRPLAGQTLPPATAVEWSTAPAPARGDVVWLYVRPAVGPADSSISLDGAAAGEPLHFERLDDGRYRSLLGIPLEGGDTLPITLGRSTGAITDTITLKLAVRHPTYANERLTVAPRYAEPDSAARARIDAELAQSRGISRRAHDTPRLWWGRFVRPRPTRITSGFGSGREFNGRVTDRHMGTDFAGKVGAPVRAAGRAVVVLVARFYLAGNAVYLDHGGGLVTGYFHLSRVVVAAGDTVAAGQVIGAVGRSGRATGPHLHWIARYGGITVNPVSLFALPAATEFGRHPAR
jgi:murein DD-endopeptidase MepM/ murein hydrolase activator NlpD